MSLAHSILGFLTLDSMTGYDLKAIFDVSVANFWRADQAQIYRTLEKLTEEGFIQFQVEIQMDRPNRKVYSITDEGRDELKKWLAAAAVPPIQRDPFLVQVFFSAVLSPQERLTLFQEQRKFHEQTLKTYEAIYIPIDVERDEMALDARLRGMTLVYGKRYEQTYIDWIDWCIDYLTKLAGTHE